MILYHITCISEDSFGIAMSLTSSQSFFKIHPFLDQWVKESYTMLRTNSPNTKSQKYFM